MDEFVLFEGGEFDEAGVEAGDADDEVAVVVGVALGLAEAGGVEDVDLEFLAAVVEEGVGEGSDDGRGGLGGGEVEGEVEVVDAGEGGGGV